MSAQQLAIVFVIVQVAELAAIGYLAFRVREMENWFHAVLKRGNR